MEPTSLYSKNYKVGINHVDFNGNLKLSSLFTYFQDIAGLHAENLGMGMKVLYEKHGVLWVLVRMRVDITRYPLLKEEIIIETWPQEPNRIEFMRDFLVKDTEGNVLAKAISTWVIIDIESRRLKKSKEIYIGYPKIIKERAIDCRLGSLKPDGQLEIAYKRKVCYSDIDINEHLNNSKYIDFIMDSFDLEVHKKYRIKSIEVNYSNEALPGDIITIYKDTSEVHSNIIYMEGIDEEKNELIFKVQIGIEEK